MKNAMNTPIVYMDTEDEKITPEVTVAETSVPEKAEPVAKEETPVEKAEPDKDSDEYINDRLSDIDRLLQELENKK